MTIDLNELNKFQLDVLKEVTNIGAGNAATALSKLLHKKIDMQVPAIELLDFSEVATLLGDEETVIVGIYLSMLGDIKGTIILAIEYNTAKALIDGMLKDYNFEDSDNGLSEMAFSALRETGNILSGAYVSALCSLLKLNIFTSIPNVVVDMAATILSMPALAVASVSDKVIYINSQFEDGDNIGIGNFFLVPELDSYETLLNALGVNI
jgi:chemotaxis protein CheC